MEKIKYILEKSVKIIIKSSIIIGLLSIILLLRFHINYYPIIFTISPQEQTLFASMVILFIFSIRFKLKYFKWIALIGISLSIVNLIGFSLLAKILHNATSSI